MGEVFWPRSGRPYFRTRYCYIRESHRYSAETGISKDAQEGICQDYYHVKLQRQGVAWGGYYYDQATSGRHIPFLLREQGWELRKKLNPGDHLVVAYHDRSTRSVLDFHILLPGVGPDRGHAPLRQPAVRPEHARGDVASEHHVQHGASRERHAGPPDQGVFPEPEGKGPGVSLLRPDGLCASGKEQGPLPGPVARGTVDHAVHLAVPGEGLQRSPDRTHCRRLRYRASETPARLPVLPGGTMGQNQPGAPGRPRTAKSWRRRGRTARRGSTSSRTGKRMAAGSSTTG